MEVKRFFASSMQEVLRMVRDDLGADAVILSNTKVDGGMEVVAALDYEEDYIPEPSSLAPSSVREPSPSQLARMHAEKHVKLQQEMESARRRIESVRDKKESIMTQSRPAAEPQVAEWNELSEMRAEIMEIKGLINNQPSQKDIHIKQNSRSVVQQQLGKTLDSLCLSKPIQKAIISSLEKGLNYDEAWAKASKQIRSAVSAEQAEIIDQGGVVSLVGPTGSGKTMTIGKMAARYVMKYGSESIALVTTDRYRIAAHEQLKVFGRILNVPVHTVDEKNSLDSILSQIGKKKLVLIDTAGLMHTDACWSEQLQELKMSPHNIKNYLVVSSVGQYQVMCANYYNYKMVELSGVIVTKVDEAVSLGEVLSFLIDTRLKAGYFTDGQRVPEDIHLFDKNEFFERAQALLNSSERWVTINSSAENIGHEAFLSHTA